MDFFFPDLQVVVLQNAGKRFPSGAAPFREKKEAVKNISDKLNLVFLYHKSTQTCFDLLTFSHLQDWYGKTRKEFPVLLPLFVEVCGASFMFCWRCIAA
jgi:hypothetical protein